MYARVLMLIFALLLGASECAKILGLWLFPGKSHFILGKAMIKGLAEFGHDVTLVSPFEDDEKPKNGSYRAIVLENLPKAADEDKGLDFLKMPDINSILFPAIMANLFNPVFEMAFADRNFQKLLNSGEKFDVVIIEQFMNDFLKPLAYHFDAHLVVFSSVFACSWVNDFTGNPAPVSYVPEIFTSFSQEMDFWQRTHNAILYLARRLILYHHTLLTQEELRKKYLPNGPSLYEMNNNVSLVLLNSHESYSQPVPLVPNMIPVGGYHIKPSKKLPADLQKILDDAPQGVVYFSMGGNIQISQFPESRRNMLVKVIGKLKQKVLWKYDKDVLPGKPANVITRKWFPQSDLLAHKNVRLFITHGGILSTSEAVYNGVPLLCFPVFGDQITNAISAEARGYALRLNYHDEANWTEERLSHLLDQLLNDPKYRENAKTRSKLFHDRPMSPMETVNYWVNYVIRSKGAHHLRVAGVTLPWYQYYLIDVILLLLTCTSVAVIISLWIFMALWRRMKKSKTKQKKA